MCPNLSLKVAWAPPWKCSSSYMWICHHSCRGYIYNQYVCICVCVYMPTYGALLTIVISTYIHLCSHLSCPSSRHFPRCPRGFTRSKPAGRRIAPRHAPFSWVGSRQGSPSLARSWLENPLINRGEYPINGCLNGINRGFNGINGGLNRGVVTLPGEFPICSNGHGGLHGLHMGPSHRFVGSRLPRWTDPHLGILATSGPHAILGNRLSNEEHIWLTHTSSPNEGSPTNTIFHSWLVIFGDTLWLWFTED